MVQGKHAAIEAGHLILLNVGCNPTAQ